MALTQSDVDAANQVKRAFGQQCKVENQEIERKSKAGAVIMIMLLIPVGIYCIFSGAIGNNTHHEYADHGFDSTYLNDKDFK